MIGTNIGIPVWVRHARMKGETRCHTKRKSSNSKLPGNIRNYRAKKKWCRSCLCRAATVTAVQAVWTWGKSTRLGAVEGTQLRIQQPFIQAIKHYLRSTRCECTSRSPREVWSKKKWCCGVSFSIKPAELCPNNKIEMKNDSGAIISIATPIQRRKKRRNLEVKPHCRTLTAQTDGNADQFPDKLTKKTSHWHGNAKDHYLSSPWPKPGWQVRTKNPALGPMLCPAQLPA